MNETTDIQSYTENKNIQQSTQPRTAIFGEGFSTLDEALKFAEIIAKTDLIPDSLKAKKSLENIKFDILIRLEMGAEVGLKPLQAIQNITVIGGHPVIWGDAALALVKIHRDYEYSHEYFEDNFKTAVCKIKRRNEPELSYKFTLDEANKAGLLNDEKRPIWKKYTKRMLQMRARSFALRDAFPDALKGMIIGEEVLDYKVKDRKSQEEIKRFEQIYEGELEKEGVTIESKPIDQNIPQTSIEDSDDEKLKEVEKYSEEELERHSNALFMLEQLIEERHIDKNTIQKWLKKGNVEYISQLKTETLEALRYNIIKWKSIKL